MNKEKKFEYINSQQNIPNQDIILLEIAYQLTEHNRTQIAILDALEEMIQSIDGINNNHLKKKYTRRGKNKK